MKRNIVILICCVLAFAGGAVAEEPDAELKVAKDYLDALYAFDFEAVGEHLAEDATFRDPSAGPLAGGPIEFDGRSAIVAGFESGSKGSRNSGYEIERSFVSSGYVVLTVTYRTEIDGAFFGHEGHWIPIRVPAVTILKLSESGAIEEHLDHVDYEALLEQVQSFRE